MPYGDAVRLLQLERLLGNKLPFPQEGILQSGIVLLAFASSLPQPQRLLFRDIKFTEFVAVAVCHARCVCLVEPRKEISHWQLPGHLVNAASVPVTMAPYVVSIRVEDQLALVRDLNSQPTVAGWPRLEQRTCP